MLWADDDFGRAGKPGRDLAEEGAAALG
jgi:hypothetical protein